MKRQKTPWQWLEQWQRSDLADEQRSYEYIRTEIQNRYPGPYRLIKVSRVYDSALVAEYVIEFDDPREETMFRLRWS